MKRLQNELPFLLLIGIIAIFLVLDLFLYPGRPATFDGVVHITNIAQFHAALSQGEFPVAWMDKFANYGMPIPLIAHQIPDYMAAAVMFLVGNPVVAFNLMLSIGVLFSCLTFYFFLRIYFNPLIAFAGTFLFNFAPYRIINVYIRADAPEIFSSIFLPIILLSLYQIQVKRNTKALYVLALVCGALALTHPLMLVTYSFIIVGYILLNIFLVRESSNKNTFLLIQSKTLLSIGCFALMGLLLAAYYIIPLNMEIKFLNQGTYKNFIDEGAFLRLKNILTPYWYYFTAQDIHPRGHVIEAGLLEVTGILLAMVVIIYAGVKRKIKDVSLLLFATLLSLLFLFLSTSAAKLIYKYVTFLDRLLFPWRIFSSLIFMPPIIFSFFLKQVNKQYITLLFIALISFLRFPQLYGKNYTNYAVSTYTFTKENLYSANLNTVWTGKTEEYPVKQEKISVISGEGKVIESYVRNASRLYRIAAKTPVRMIDYTFYFPGWTVYVDGKKVPIEFQDPTYRGVITYNVPQGVHKVAVIYEDTKMRQLGKALSVAACILLGMSLVFYKSLQTFLFQERKRSGK